jgi:hypothetical protein
MTAQDIDTCELIYFFASLGPHSGFQADGTLERFISVACVGLNVHSRYTLAGAVLARQGSIK